MSIATHNIFEIHSPSREQPPPSRAPVTDAPQIPKRRHEKVSDEGSTGEGQDADSPLRKRFQETQSTYILNESEVRSSRIRDNSQRLGIPKITTMEYDGIIKVKPLPRVDSNPRFDFGDWTDAGPYSPYLSSRLEPWGMGLYEPMYPYYPSEIEIEDEAPYHRSTSSSNLRNSSSEFRHRRIASSRTSSKGSSLSFGSSTRSARSSSSSCHSVPSPFSLDSWSPASNCYPQTPDPYVYYNPTIEFRKCKPPNNFPTRNQRDQASGPQLVIPPTNHPPIRPLLVDSPDTYCVTVRKDVGDGGGHFFFDSLQDLLKNFEKQLVERFQDLPFDWSRFHLEDSDTKVVFTSMQSIKETLQDNSPRFIYYAIVETGPAQDRNVNARSLDLRPKTNNSVATVTTASATATQELSTTGSRDKAKSQEAPTTITDETLKNALETGELSKNEPPDVGSEHEKVESEQEQEIDQMSLCSIDISGANKTDFSQSLQSTEPISTKIFATENSTSQIPQSVHLDTSEGNKARPKRCPVSPPSGSSCGNKAKSSDQMDTESLTSAVSTLSISCATEAEDISTESSPLALHNSKTLLLQRLIDTTNMQLQTKIKIWSLKQFSERLACPFAKLHPEKHVNCLAINYRTVFEVKSHILRCHLGSKRSENGQLEKCETWEEIFKFCFPDSHNDNQPSPYLSFDPLINHLTAYTNAEDYISYQMETLKTQQTNNNRHMEECLKNRDSGRTNSQSENFDNQNDDETLPLEHESPMQSDYHDIEDITTQDADGEFNNEEHRSDNLSELEDNFVAIAPTDIHHETPKTGGEISEDKLITLERTSKIQAIYMLSILMILRNAAHWVSGTSILQPTQFNLDPYIRQAPHGQSDNGRSSASTSHRSGASTTPSRSSSQRNGGVQKRGGDDGKGRRGPRKPHIPKHIPGKLQLQHEYCCPCAIVRCERHRKCWTPRIKYSFSLTSLRHHLKRDHFNGLLPDELKYINAPTWADMFLTCAKLCQRPWQGELPSCSVYIDCRDPERVYEDIEAHYQVAMGFAEFSKPGSFGEFASASSKLVAPMQGVSYEPQNPTAEVSQPEALLHHAGGGVDELADLRAPVETLTSAFSEQSLTTNNFNHPIGFQQNMNLYGPPHVNATNAIPNTGFADLNANGAGVHDQAANWSISSVASQPSFQFSAPPSLWNNSYTDSITSSSSSSGVGRGQIPWGYGLNGYISPVSSVSISSKQRGIEQSKRYRIAVERGDDSGSLDEEAGYLVVDFDSTGDISTNLLQKLQTRFISPPFTWDDWKLLVRNEGKSYRSSKAIAERMHNDPPPRLDPPEDHIHKLAFAIVKV
ncbi:hypothetical protein H072_10948 [Dactylellina haptotyla CBS 200.50]|uniref:Uncharacterized protein n=1 Tax=Dactylellina haptotyla (strain CBS 200.50) TaxID=1284197 RepID=S7ZXZ5_DACHA|nr:hypothetical protein H072_10948 [Dactylellina haptotyla CBS 200.50]